MNISDFESSINPLAQHYQYFDVENRLLLTGHSHQAWPDCAKVGQLKAFSDASLHVDDKWSKAFEAASSVRDGFANHLGVSSEQIALGQNTHLLVTQFLSGLPLFKKPRIVTTNGEFHSLRRQLNRLREEGMEIVSIASENTDATTSLIIEAINSDTSAVMVSAVFYRSARMLVGLGDIMKACEKVGAELLVDAYHAINVIPFNLESLGLQNAYIVGGGYKYCQLGEGNCFLRVPSHCKMRPIITGWFAEFETTEEEVGTGLVQYSETKAARFAGATYDPTSHYRAKEVFHFFAQHKLTPLLLRQISQHQIGLLCKTFDSFDLDPSIISRPDLPIKNIAGFLALRSRFAQQICRALKRQGVSVDSRDDIVRFGPAPYLNDKQLTESMHKLAKIIKKTLRHNYPMLGLFRAK